MTGIDIIDFHDPLLRNRKHAIRLISHPEDNQEDFWALWTAKEAIFKTYRQIKPFRPKEIPITFNDSLSYTSDDTTGYIHQTTNYLVSIASKAQHQEYVIFERETNSPSNEVRVKISEWFLDHGIKTEVEQDQNRLPVLTHNQSPISISHHGRYLAFAYPIR
tara:strand:- start:175 stop:660 length:486 start_codon:yes stop_codon:yes gene_type:complete